MKTRSLTNDLGLKKTRSPTKDQGLKKTKTTLETPLRLELPSQHLHLHLPPPPHLHPKTKTNLHPELKLLGTRQLKNQTKNRFYDTWLTKSRRSLHSATCLISTFLGHDSGSSIPTVSKPFPPSLSTSPTRISGYTNSYIPSMYTTICGTKNAGCSLN